jgi:exonuclease III
MVDFVFLWQMSEMMFDRSLDSSNPDIICGNETWLKPSICKSEIFPDESDYEIFRKDRKDGFGGVMLAIKSNINSNPIVFEDQLISGKFKSPPIQMVDFVFLWQMSEMMFDRSLEYPMLLLGGVYMQRRNLTR